MKTNELPKMNPPTQPSPPFALPLLLDESQGQIGDIVDAEGKSIAQVQPQGTLRNQRNDLRQEIGRHLVRAANALPGLVAALALAHAQHVMHCPNCGDVCSPVCAVGDQMRAALKAAEAQP